jgi:hypothetical protein
VLVGGAPVNAPAISTEDLTELPHGSQFTYFVQVQFTDGSSSPASNFSTITAENDAPVAVGESYSVAAGATLAVPSRGVLTNDTDTDSLVASLTAVLVTGPASAASFTLNADGSFTYTPAAGFSGTDSFTYVAKDVTPVSSRNVPATVTISVSAPVPQYTIVIYPLRTPANLGSAVVIDYVLRNTAGALVTSLDTLVKMESVFNGAVPPGGCVASATGVRTTLYSPATGATGGSSFRLVSNRFRFNWDSSTASPTGVGCYTVLISLNDGSAPKMTTPVQLR